MIGAAMLGGMSSEKIAANGAREPQVLFDLAAPIPDACACYAVR